MRVIDETLLNQMNTIKQGRNLVTGSTWGGKNTHRQSRAVTYRPREPGGTSGLPDHGGEEGAMVERLGREAKAESWIQRLEAETGDPPAMMPMETGRPAVIPPHRWWEQVREGWHLWASGLSGLHSGTKSLPGLPLEHKPSPGWTWGHKPPGSQNCTQEQKPSTGQTREQKPSPGQARGQKPTLGWTRELKPSLGHMWEL